MIDLHDIQERVVLVSIDSDSKGISAADSLLELELLAETAGAAVVAVVIQKRERAHTAHYLGKGKLEELRLLIENSDATGVICDDELTSVQIKNLEVLLNTKVMDRTILIMDIFAARASSKEGKIQVELALQKYRLSHLSGLGKELSRLGGGIGTRGPGEKKLETDRRHIRSAISQLTQELSDIDTHRQLLRESRMKKGMPIVSIIGYTNSGKSTLMNALTAAGVLAEDKLFATLDTIARKLTLPGGTLVQLTDTVGFIQKLPHQLIKAFRSTLDELKYADILLHVVDASSENIKDQMNTVYDTIRELGCIEPHVITLFNKIDKNISMPLPFDKNAIKTLNISAKDYIGLSAVLNAIEDELKRMKKLTFVVIPYEEGSLLSIIHGNCEIVSLEHKENGTHIKAFMNEEIRSKLSDFII